MHTRVCDGGLLRRNDNFTLRITQVSLTNPTDKPLHLRAVYGCCSLLGPSSFVAPAGPGAETTFECYYAPLVQGSEEGVLRLVSKEVGWHACNTMLSVKYIQVLGGEPRASRLQALREGVILGWKGAGLYVVMMEITTLGWLYPKSQGPCWLLSQLALSVHPACPATNAPYHWPWTALRLPVRRFLCGRMHRLESSGGSWRYKLPQPCLSHPSSCLHLWAAVQLTCSVWLTPRLWRPTSPAAAPLLQDSG